MPNGEMDFERIVIALVARFCVQSSHPASDASIARLAAQLRQVVADLGLPAPLPEGTEGVSGGMSEAECAPLVARVMAGIEDSRLAEPARQLVKACFYPEFKVCRDSFREVGRDGSCRRQELERARGRISGVHCVDCPHWMALAPVDHGEFLMAEWRRDPSLFALNRDVFLPEDFRALRHWLHAAARRKQGAPGQIFRSS